MDDAEKSEQWDEVASSLRKFSDKTFKIAGELDDPDAAKMLFDIATQAIGFAGFCEAYAKIVRPKPH